MILDYSDDWIAEAQLDSKVTEIFKDSILTTIESNNLKNDTYGTSCRGDIKQYELLNKIDQSLLSLIKSITIDQLVRNKVLDNHNYKLRETTIWTCVGKKGSYHTVHNHNSARNYYSNYVSTTIYLQTPEMVGTDGLFYSFFRNNQIVVKPPSVGKILIFPIWLFHGTYPQPEGDRQTLNLTFEIIPHTP